MDYRGGGQASSESHRQAHLGCHSFWKLAGGPLAHLSVDDITAPDGYKQIVAVIEETHAYLKEARLEQAFDAAILRRPGQTLTGFLATKKAAFAELKR